MERWVGKVAVVTGASSGIGAVIAEKLVEEGLKVVGLARRKDRLDVLAKNLSDKKGYFYPYQADVSKEEDVVNAFKWTKDNVGLVHILVNNAGIFGLYPIADFKTDDVKNIINVNVIALLVATREALKVMNENNINGHIIHINSEAGHKIIDHPGMGAYTSSKYAVTALTKSMQNEIKQSKKAIKVTSISPGLVETEIVGQEMWERMKKSPNYTALKSKDIADAVVYVLATPPNCQVEELTLSPIFVKE